MPCGAGRRWPSWRSVGGPPRLAGLAVAASGLGQVVTRVGSEGRDPASGERRRLLLAGAAAGFALGWLVTGLLLALAFAGGTPWLVARMLSARRERYRRAVDSGTAAMALAMADALSGGHSLRGAVHEAARGVPGAAGREMGRVSAELALGARTEAALDAMRSRVRSHRVDTVVAAC